MSSRLAFMWGLDAAKLTTIRSIRATVPVLLTKAPMAEVTAMMRINRRSSLFSGQFENARTEHFGQSGLEDGPSDDKQADHHNDYGVGEPRQGFFRVRIWNISRATKAHNATMSERIFPLTKNMAERIKMQRVVSMDENMLGFIS